jgi:hypothetical protein
MAKENQNFSNHRQWQPLFHFVFYPAALLVLVAGIRLMTTGNHSFEGALTVLIAFNILLIGVLARMFGLKAQDRAIRAEESLRYFILTGKPISKNLRLGQIIALRFASDEEFVALAARAENENLKSKEIKQAIKNWRGDYHRV